jgi:hypothetical protein
MSSFIRGQPRLAKTWLKEIVEARRKDEDEEDKSLVVQQKDVINAILAIYERVGDAATMMSTVEIKKMNEKELKKARKARQKEGVKDMVE